MIAVPTLFSGGNGETAKSAVVINASRSAVGVAAEYRYVEQVCGKRDVDWTLEMQMQTTEEEEEYDVVTVNLTKGGSRTFWFDITAFFGKF